ncbi:MAG: 2-oxoacid:acceptor oxidoreductase family protein [Patescibacteria group bacterium]
MKEIRIHGRGGQGAVTAAELLARAVFYAGKYSQAFPNFGVERRGAPLEAYVRVSDQSIRLRQQVYHPDFLIIMDKSLLMSSRTVHGVKKNTIVLVNSEHPCRCSNLKTYHVPATSIALEALSNPNLINTALMGAFAVLTGLVTADSLERAAQESFFHKGEDIIQKNIIAMKVARRFIEEEYLKK